MYQSLFKSSLEPTFSSPISDMNMYISVRSEFTAVEYYFVFEV